MVQLPEKETDGGRVGTLRVSTVKNPGCLDESAMTEKVLDGMMRKHGSQDERCWFIMKWQPLAQKAVLIATTPPWPDSVLQINPLPEHFASVSKVLGEMMKDPGFKKFWGCRKGAGELHLLMYRKSWVSGAFALIFLWGGASLLTADIHLEGGTSSHWPKSGRQTKQEKEE